MSNDPVENHEVKKPYLLSGDEAKVLQAYNKKLLDDTIFDEPRLGHRLDRLAVIWGE